MFPDTRLPASRRRRGTVRKWEDAMPEIKQEWGAALTAEIQAKADAERTKLEVNMDGTINKEWNKAKDKVGENWKKES